MNDEMPKLLGFKHHDHFISEFLFDPDELNLGLLIDYFESMDTSGIYIPRNTLDTKDTQIFLNEIIGGGYYPHVSDYTTGATSSVYQSYQKISTIAIGSYFEEYECLKIRRMEHKICKLQRTKPSQGFHAWHSDQGGDLSFRQLVTLLYLNDDFEGGETEFLHQSLRIKPQAGKFVIFPAFWTHLHRGNPPMGGNKYILTSWVEEYPNSTPK
tara:strand:- start:1803 stop:2438 length:636 start_codon:yes stop_codon:yes gene_type:complete